MPKRKPIAKRQRPQVVKPRHPAVLQGKPAGAVTGAAVSVGERELKLARAFADTEARVRDASLESLRSWLGAHGAGLGADDVDRLWKALFYCVWMADVRGGAAARVTATVAGLHDVLGWAGLRGALRCLAREWGGVDRHRVDKFYALLDAVLARGVGAVVAAPDAPGLRAAAGEFVACVVEVLVPAAAAGAKGVLMHVLDAWVDAVLVPVLAAASKMSANAAHPAWDALLVPLYPILKMPGGRLAAVRARLEERVLRRLPQEEVLSVLDVPPRAKHDMLTRTSKAVFAAAADPGTPEEERKLLYALRTTIKAVNIGLKSEMEAATVTKED